MGIYSSIKSAPVSKKSEYYQPGMYRTRINAVKEVKSTQNPGKVFFVVETTCVNSDNPQVVPGREYSQVIDLTNVMAFANIKVFVAAASGIDPFEHPNDELNDAVEKTWSEALKRRVDFEQIVELIVSDAQPLKDMELDLSCANIPTKAGRDFTKYNWMPIFDDPNS